MNWPRLKLPWSITFASFINALSIPLIAGILVWLLNRILSPAAWCPVLEEFKLSNATLLASWRCQPIIMAQLDIGKYVAIGLVGALSLSHLVSVIREAKAGLELSTKLGSLKVGGDAPQAAQVVADAAQSTADVIKDADPPAMQEPTP